jgi:hypothetical protein
MALRVCPVALASNCESWFLSNQNSGRSSCGRWMRTIERAKTRLVVAASHLARGFLRARRPTRVTRLIPRLLPLVQKIDQ